MRDPVHGAQVHQLVHDAVVNNPTTMNALLDHVVYTKRSSLHHTVAGIRRQVRGHAHWMRDVRPKLIAILKMLGASEKGANSATPRFVIKSELDAHDTPDVKRVRASLKPVCCTFQAGNILQVQLRDNEAAIGGAARVVRRQSGGTTTVRVVSREGSNVKVKQRTSGNEETSGSASKTPTWGPVETYARDALVVKQLPSNKGYTGISVSLDPRVILDLLLGLGTNDVSMLSMQNPSETDTFLCWKLDASSQFKSDQDHHVSTTSLAVSCLQSGNEVSNQLGGSHLMLLDAALWLGKDGRKDVHDHALPVLDAVAVAMGQNGDYSNIKQYCILDYKQIWESSGGQSNGLAQTDNPINNLPKSVAKLTTEDTTYPLFYSFPNISIEQERKTLTEGTKEYQAYRNIANKNVFSGLGIERWHYVHGPLHSPGRTGDPIIAALLLPLANATRQLNLFTTTHMRTCIGFMYEHRFQCTDGMYQNIASISVTRKVLMHERLWPYACGCGFKCPPGYEDVWWLVNCVLISFRISRRPVLTRDLKFQEDQGQHVTAMATLHESLKAKLIGDKGKTPSNRHFASLYGWFFKQAIGGKFLVSRLAHIPFGI